MKIIKIILICTWFAIAQIFAQQTATISGEVLEKQTNTTLSYVQVVIVGTTIGTTTNENGQFNITGLKPGTYEIKATMMGYSPTSIKATVENGSEVVVTFELNPNVLEADEIFVTATKMDKAVKNIGGAVYMIQESELRQSDSRNIQDVLTRVPGEVNFLSPISMCLCVMNCLACFMLLAKPFLPPALN